MSNLKYKVGDKVRIKTLDWYNENKDEFDEVPCKGHTFVKSMALYCDSILTIVKKIEDCYYWMKDIPFCWTDEMIEGLVEKETKPKFKVGDKIKLKSTLVTDIFSVIGYESEGYRITNISNGLTYLMSYRIEPYYELMEKEFDFEKMYMESEKRYEEEYSKGEYCHKQSFKWGFQEGYDYAHENEKLEINLKTGYEFKNENGNVINAKKIVLEKKKEYPKTYEECINELHTHKVVAACAWKKMKALQKLLVCRDAYWKIAGEEMGLGKPWEPSGNEDCFVISRSCGEVYLYSSAGDCEPFEFPTEEMRDAFYENFKELIESCKELL